MTETYEFDACVIGAGPAGLASALRLAQNNLRVALVESGGSKFDRVTQALSDAVVDTPRSHSAMANAVQRGLGGTSAIWGGRCVPLDAMDFEPRAHVPNSGWPIRADDLMPFMADATAFLSAGDAAFEVSECRGLTSATRPLASGLLNNGQVLATRLERWSMVADSWTLHGKSVRANANIDLIPGWTCVGLEQGESHSPVRSALLARRDSRGVATRTIRARSYVLACGGVESTRLVLHALRGANGLKLTQPHLVGKFYMGHPSGKIADIEFAASPRETIFGFERDGPVYVRRRLTLAPELMARAKLLNIAFWLDNSPIHDAVHGSGVLSAAYLALKAPVLGKLLAPTAIRKRLLGNERQMVWPHLRNCIVSPLQTMAFCAAFLAARYLSTPRLPGFFTYSPANRYALHYHAEQVPRHDSEITLDDSCDALGMPKARIALRWSEQDVESILDAHSELARGLRDIGAATLHWRFDAAERRQAILDQAEDGYHQLGTLRMASSPQCGVTDEFGRFFGAPNLYAATSAIFPTAGQANPTLSMLALVLRQADELVRVTRRSL